VEAPTVRVVIPAGETHQFYLDHTIGKHLGNWDLFIQLISIDGYGTLPFPSCQRRKMTIESCSSFLQRPVTRLGWWAVGLALAFMLMFILNSTVFMGLPEDVPWRQTVLPFYGIFMLLCGLAAGVVGLIAVIRKHERSWMVWVTILPGALVLFLLLGEFLVPH
jgi:hypothetical protein